jgi:hypothetical protein
MPLIAPAIKSKFKQRIYDGFKKNFGGAASKGEGYSSTADEFWMKIADAISDIAIDMVEEITTNAMVMPGQSVVGAGGGVPGPMSGSTVSPGKIT